MPARRAIAPIGLLTLLLLVPAIHNGFPLIFPDSGTYLGIAFGPEYALDRSSYYGLLLKPLVASAPGVAGLWIAIAVQALAVALVLWAVAGRFDAEGSGPWRRLAWLAPAALLTALPWHAGQFMPDALTGILVLWIWLAVDREAGSLAISCCGRDVVAALPSTPIAVAVAAAAAACRRRVAGSSGALRCSVGSGSGGGGAGRGPLVTKTGRARPWSISPSSPVFVYARLNEDGLIALLARHCAATRPRGCRSAANCPRQPAIPVDGAPADHRTIWPSRPPARRWAWLRC